MKFYYVYILHNIDKKFIYAGYSEDVKKRFETHNKGEVASTKAYLPLKLIHYEAYNNMKDAKRREEYFKTTKGKNNVKVNAQRIFFRNLASNNNFPQSKNTIFFIHRLEPV